MSTHHQVLFGNMQFFGKILLKNVLTLYSNIQHHYHQASHNNSSMSSLTSPTAPSTTHVATTSFSYLSSKTLISSLITASPVSLPHHLVPELIPINYTASSPTSKWQHRRSHSPFSTSSSSAPHVSILTSSSLHKYATTYSPPIIFDTSFDLTETTSISSTIFSVATNTLFFPGTCHRSAYLVFLPDPSSDLVVDFRPLIDSTFKEFYDPDDEDPEDKELEDFLTVYLFEEDEIEMERRKREKTFTWTITIPRPPDSIALPRPKIFPGQERERGKGWSRRRQGRWHGKGHYCLGGKAMDVDTEYALRHWIVSLSNTTSILRNEMHIYDNVTDEWLRTETYETEPRIAALIRSINKLDKLVT